MARNVDYDQIAKTYDQRYKENDYSGVVAALMAFVGEHFDGHILEVGCGTGHWLRSLDSCKTRVMGLDASAQMLACARVEAPGAVLVQGVAESLPWIGESFDRVFCINALHHFRDQAAFLREVARVLRPNGQLMTIGLDPHAGIDRWYVYEFFDSVLESDRRRYSASSQIREWMRSSGFAACVTREVQHLQVRLDARVALEQGRLGQSVTSQLSLLTDAEYRQGLDRIHEAAASVERRGESLYLDADLRL
jgi:SAM-dependent methyltransferase